MKLQKNISLSLFFSAPKNAWRLLRFSLLSLVFLATPLAIASTDCRELGEELKSMQVAQQKMLSSLVSNHESFASVLEEFSDVLMSTKAPAKGIYIKMDDSAQAFRKRGIQGKLMAGKLNGATTDLIERVTACLK